MLKLSTLAAASALVFLPLAAQAAITTYSLNLDATKEVPAVNSPAVGSMQIRFDDVADTVTFSFAAFSLRGTYTMAHIHRAPEGVNGPVVFDFGANFDASGPVTVGGFSVPNSFSFVGSNKAISGALIDQINAAPWNFYVNFHTSFAPGGEIRGQLAPIPEPGTYALMALGLGAVAFVARRRARRA